MMYDAKTHMMHKLKSIQQIGTKKSKTSKTPKILWFEIFEKFNENACMHVI